LDTKSIQGLHWMINNDCKPASFVAGGIDIECTGDKYSDVQQYQGMVGATIFYVLSHDADLRRRPRMIKVRRSENRGSADFGWLKSRHTFSFGEYDDSGFMGYGPLRVINEDRVQPSEGFPKHSHRDMEIIRGCLKARSSTKTASVRARSSVQVNCSA